MNTQLRGIKIPWVTSLIVAVSFAVHWMGWDARLEFQPVFGVSTLLQVLTCHIAHYSVSHLTWSLGAFAFLGTLCEMRGRARFVGCMVVSAIVIPIALAIFHPWLHHFRGMSGIDSALFILLAADIALDEAVARPALSAAAVVLILAFAMKVTFEQITRTTVFANGAEGGFVPAPISHIAGAVIGMIFALPARVLNQIALAPVSPTA